MLLTCNFYHLFLSLTTISVIPYLEWHLGLALDELKLKKIKYDNILQVMNVDKSTSLWPNDENAFILHDKKSVNKSILIHYNFLFYLNCMKFSPVLFFFLHHLFPHLKSIIWKSYLHILRQLTKSYPILLKVFLLFKIGAKKMLACRKLHFLKCSRHAFVVRQSIRFMIWCFQNEFK